MRVVVDTNVLVSAMYAERSAARNVVRCCLRREVEPLLGPALFAEYEDVFGRDDPFRKAHVAAAEREIILDAFLSVCAWINVSFLWRPNLRDEGDNHLFELAIAGNANVIVTANTRDLTSGDLRFDDLRIATPGQFLEEHM